MKYKKIELLTQVNAEQIFKKLHYSGKYSFYVMENDPEDFEKIIIPKLRGNKYYQVLNDKDELVGYFCLERLSEKRVKVGLGLRPDLTGHRLELNFVKEIEEFVRKTLNIKLWFFQPLASINVRLKFIRKQNLKKTVLKCKNQTMTYMNLLTQQKMEDCK